MKKLLKFSTERRVLLSGCIMSLVVAPSLALADAKYTTVTSIAQGGALKPATTTTTWMKTGLERIDSQQDLGFYKSSESTISNRATKQKITYDPALKIFVAQPLNAPLTSSNGNAGSSADSGKSGVGTFILTVGAKFLGMGKMLNLPVRHYNTSVATQTSGCCGVGKSSFKSETWMADVKLPVFDSGAPAMDWRSAFSQGRNNCKINFQRKGDIKGYEAAQKGLALKTITFDASGKPMMSMEVTSLSMAGLGAAPFAVPAGFKKVTRAEYDAARAKAMMASMAPQDNG